MCRMSNQQQSRRWSHEVNSCGTAGVWVQNPEDLHHFGSFRDSKTNHFFSCLETSVSWPTLNRHREKSYISDICKRFLCYSFPFANNLYSNNLFILRVLRYRKGFFLWRAQVVCGISSFKLPVFSCPSFLIFTFPVHFNLYLAYLLHFT
jgi:hypothetical protein